MNQVIMTVFLLITFAIIICVTHKSKVSCPGKAIAVILLVPVLKWVLTWLGNVVVSIMHYALLSQSIALYDMITAGLLAIFAILQEIFMLFGYILLYKFICVPKEPLKKILVTQSKMVTILLFILIFLFGFLQFTEYMLLVATARVSSFRPSTQENFLSTFTAYTNPFIQLIITAGISLRILILGLEAYACRRQTAK